MLKLIIITFTISSLFTQNVSYADTTRIKEIDQNSSIQEFFRTIAKHYKLNVMVDSDINIRDHFQFYNLSLKDITAFIAAKYELRLTTSNGVIRLSKKAKEVKKVAVKKEAEAHIDVLDGKLSLDVKKMDIRKFASILSKKSERSILLESNLSGSISGQLWDVDFNTGLNELLEINGFRIRRKKSIYRIERLYSFQENKTGKNGRASGFFVDVSDSLVVLDAPKANLSDVLSTLIKQSNINVIFYNDVKGQVSARLQEKSLDEILVKLFRNTEFTFKRNSEGVYFFGKKSIKDLVSQEVVHLKYLRAGAGSSSSYQRPSSLSNRSLNSALSSSFSRNASQQQNRNTSINSSQGRNPLRNRSATTSRKNSSSSSEGYTAEALYQELERNNIQALPLVEQNAILVSGTQQDIEDAKDIIRMLDQPVPQIFIEALIIDVKNNIDLEKEIRAYRHGDGYDSVQTKTSYIPFEMLFNAADLNPITSKIGEALGSKRIGILPKDFFAFLKVQERKNNIKVNSRPQITTTNGEEAYITIGETRYFKISDGRIIDNIGNQQQNNVNVTVRDKFEKLDIVNTLRVKPWANYDGDVTVKVTPEFQTPIGGTSDLPPSIEFRELDSTVRLKNGQTLILGGLIREENSVIERDYFPLLSWLPLIGDWFKSKSKGEGRSELLIYITPHVYYGDQIQVNIPKSHFK